MPVSNLYASVEELASRAPAIFGQTPGEITDEQRTAAELLLEAISRAIDSKTRREPGAFSPSPEAATERTFYGNNRPCLEMPDYVPGSLSQTVTSIGGVTVPSFVEYRGQLCITDADGVMIRTEKWREGVPYRVTARWGWAAPPADIREACLIWAGVRARLNAGDMSGAVTTIVRDGATLMRDELPPTVKDLLAPYVLAEREDVDEREGMIETGDIRSTDDHPFDPFKRFY